MTLPSSSPEPALLAAVDLGSNSFHMVVAQEWGTELRLLDRLREGVRLAEGLGEDGSLDPKVASRALECLARFAQRLQGVPPERVRVIGTNTLRLATRAEDFVAAIQKTLGFPVEIVAGREEARLIYLGVAHSLAVDAGERRLVIDIGGGSTEVIAGTGFQPWITESLSYGCVGSTRKFFADGRITEAAMAALQNRVRLAIEPSLGDYFRHGWDQAIGSSGTIKAVLRILGENGLGSRITPTGLEWLREQVLQLGQISALHKLRGLKAERAAVFPGGLAILLALFASLRIQEMRFSEGALREGAIYDLLGRIHHEDSRELSIANLQQRFHSQVQRNAEVTEWAVRLFAAARHVWGLHDGHLAWLRWAAATHDIGLDIAHSGFHKHGEYIWRNADIAGFSRREQNLIACLVRCQRKKLPSLSQLQAFGVAAEDAEPLQQLAVLLRLAIVLQRGAAGLAHTPTLTIRGRTLELRFPADWRAVAPLLAADLEQEQGLVGPDFQVLF